MGDVVYDDGATAGGDGAFVFAIASDSRLDAISSPLLPCAQMDFFLLGMALLGVGGTCGGSDAADALCLLLWSSSMEDMDERLNGLFSSNGGGIGTLLSLMLEADGLVISAEVVTWLTLALAGWGRDWVGLKNDWLMAA